MPPLYSRSYRSSLRSDTIGATSAVILLMTLLLAMSSPLSFSGPNRPGEKQKAWVETHACVVVRTSGAPTISGRYSRRTPLPCGNAMPAPIRGAHDHRGSHRVANVDVVP